METAKSFKAEFKRRACLFLLGFTGAVSAILLADQEIIPEWLAAGLAFPGILAGFKAILGGGFIFKSWPPVTWRDEKIDSDES